MRGYVLRSNNRTCDRESSCLVSVREDVLAQYPSFQSKNTDSQTSMQYAINAVTTPASIKSERYQLIQPISTLHRNQGDSRQSPVHPSYSVASSSGTDP